MLKVEPVRRLEFCRCSGFMRQWTMRPNCPLGAIRHKKVPARHPGCIWSASRGVLAMSRLFAMSHFPWHQAKSLALVGQSGCGKSTLLRLIAGVDRQDEGRIALNGAEIAGPSQFSSSPRSGVSASIFQDYALFPHLDVIGEHSVRPEEACQSRQQKPARRDDRRRGLVSGICRTDIRTCCRAASSSAWRWRALWRREPRILLMDEPFSNLDRKLRDGVREETLALLRRTAKRQ